MSIVWSFLTRASRTTGSRSIDGAVAKAAGAGVFDGGRKVGGHTLRHSYARHSRHTASR